MARLQWAESALDQYDEALAPIFEDNFEVGVSIFNKSQEMLQLLQAYPESFPIVADPLRKLSVPGYPYCFYYEYRGDGVVRIAAFLHDKQTRPGDARGQAEDPS